MKLIAYILEQAAKRLKKTANKSPAVQKYVTNRFDKDGIFTMTVFNLIRENYQIIIKKI